MSFFFRVAYWSKSRIYRILNWKYCSPHFLNGHVTEIKYKEVPFLGPFINGKVEFSEYWLESTAVSVFEMATWLMLKCQYLEEVTL